MNQVDLTLHDTCEAVASSFFVWLERDGDGPARAFIGASTEPLPVKRNDNNLEINAKGRGDVRFVNSSAPPREDKEKGGAIKTIYYAKAGRTDTATKLHLELVPTAPNANMFVLLFFAAPLLKAEVTIIGPSKWEKPLVTDEQGRVTLPTPWVGR